ncbi:MAG: NnrS family protein [Ideonella sp.]|nr:NnrS family protein [Ideonella sp.]MCC7457301.1 NnrS family protein [Nitrospira sp.]
MTPPAPHVTVPWLASPFRPFYLLGALYAPLLALGGAGAFFGFVDLGGAGALMLWHGHEMLFGFASAIVIGTLLTALPSWAGLTEWHGAPLGALALLWLAGRVAFWAAPWLPPLAVALVDGLLWPLMLALLAAPLWRLRQRLYRLLLPVLAGFALANAAYHGAVLAADVHGAERALRAAVWTLVVLFTLIGGLLTPVFTGNALRTLRRGEPARFSLPLESVALALLLALALADVAGAPSRTVGVLALACTAVHGVRVVRWRGWRVLDQPLLPTLHLGFAWLLLAFALKAAAGLGAALPEPAWLHAFTVGALGAMMLGLMTRVSLRHTGRALRVPPAMQAAALAVFAAAALRLAAGMQALATPVVALAAALWAAAFIVYLVQFASVLLAPSLPRQAVDDEDGTMRP